MRTEHGLQQRDGETVRTETEEKEINLRVLGFESCLCKCVCMHSACMCIYKCILVVFNWRQKLVLNWTFNR